MTKMICLFIITGLSAALLGGCGSSGSSPSYGASGSGGTSGRNAASIGTESGHLVDANGFALYETAGSCTSTCLTVWPPVDASTVPTAEAGVTGAIALSGGQVTYNGHLLYYFESDTSAGQATGNGEGGFSLVTP